MSHDSHPHRSLLAVDIGNTVVHMGVFDGEIVRSTSTVSTRDLTDEDEVAALEREVGAIAISSVVPELTPLFSRVAARLGLSPLIVTHELNLGIDLEVEKPWEVGADRICNAVAAHFEYGSPAVVVDFGTAITFDVIDSGGVYRGGLILPGAAISAQCLHLNTAKLPLVELRKPKGVIGASTEEAIRSGVFYAIVGGIRSIFRTISSQIGDAELILTGGGLPLFEGELGIGGRCDPHLTLQGLRFIYERNAC